MRNTIKNLISLFVVASLAAFVGSSHPERPSGDEALLIRNSYRQPVGTIQDYLGTTAPTGWLLLNGSTIGNAASGATGRAADDTLNLYTLLWNSLSNTEAPVSGGRGASAAADFAANKTLTMPDARQRFAIMKASAGTGATLGGTGGNIDHTHSVPGHYHGMGTGADLNITASGSHTHTQRTQSGPAALTGLATITTSNELTTVSNINAATHTHAAGDFAGRIGLVTGGVDGNAAMTSGTGNPPFLAVNRIIYYGPGQ